MNANESTFLESIKLCFEEWKALEIAIREGMGGRDAVAKREWMAHVVFDYFKQYADTGKDEICEYIAVIVDNEFDTCVQDGSLEYLAYMLCKYRDMCFSGQHEEVRAIIDNKMRERLRNQTLSQISEVTDRMENVEINATSNDEVPIDHEQNDGWTVVKRKGKRS
ncbi:pre-rRNA-processing protein TSR2-like isoform X1 [Dinothrombium tinctorium]|uniref:Pre-rRNA-processing protein TSR2 homolog n=1 Tax=Dinothrombium tinctorium TaxID=1965070 RepID=A0A3S3QEH9_9ACAR|nr:pre-rRNA-processing protein TSR2-like isoform X1 [Dinothrombium tinctorium]